MRNNSFFEKLTGSLRLSDADLNALNEPDTQAKQDNKVIKSSPTANKAKDDDYDEIIEEVDEDDFEIPDDENIETIEEIIEDDSIDEEEVEEYYEEIIDEDEDDDITPVINTSIYGDTNKYSDDVVVENTHNDYPVFKMKNDNNSEVNEDKEKVAATIPEAKIEHKEMFSSLESDLPIDLFEMHNEIVLRVLVPGITPENLKVSITRDHVSLTCTRPSPEGIDDSSYFEREIPYGDFTRMIHLPSDVDVEHAEAVEKYGLLIIRLPKLDSKKVQELKIKSV